MAHLLAFALLSILQLVGTTIEARKTVPARISRILNSRDHTVIDNQLIDKSRVLSNRFVKGNYPKKSPKSLHSDSNGQLQPKHHGRGQKPLNNDNAGNNEFSAGKTGKSNKFSETGMHNGKKKTAPQIGRDSSMRGKLCSSVNCDFDEARLCRYRTGGRTPLSNTSLVQVPWLVSDGDELNPITNSLTGIFDDASGSGRFAYATLNESSPIQNVEFYLRSPEFSIRQPASIVFRYYQAGVMGRLRACVQTLRAGPPTCPFVSEGSNIAVDSRRWKHGQIQLPKGSHVISFIVDGLHKNYIIGLDNVFLRDVDGVEPAGCSNII